MEQDERIKQERESGGVCNYPNVAKSKRRE